MNESDKTKILKEASEVKQSKVFLHELQPANDGFALVTVENPALVAKEAIQKTLEDYPSATHLAIMMLNAVTLKASILFHESKFYLRGIFTLYLLLPSIDPVSMDRATILDKLDEMNELDKRERHVRRLKDRIKTRHDRVAKFIDDFNPHDTKIALIELEGLDEANELIKLFDDIEKTGDTADLTLFIKRRLEGEDEDRPQDPA